MSKNIRKMNSNGTMPLQAHVRRIIAAKLREDDLERQALAKHMKLAPTRVSEILNGDRNIQLDELPRIADFFKIPLFALLAVKGKHDGCPLCQTPMVRTGKKPRRSSHGPQYQTA